MSTQDPTVSTHILKSSQVIAADPDRVWAFFSSPDNLARLTPASLGFESHTQAARTVEGAEFEYTVRPLLGIPRPWRSLIESVEEPTAFSDVQLEGPYKSWRHEHRFTPVDGGVRVDDTVTYEMPFGPLGPLGHRMVVRDELEHIFNYRSHAVRDIFESAGPAEAGRRGVVAVAGGTGFVGGEIARELRRRGRTVVVLSSRGEQARGRLPDDIEIRRIDITDPISVDAALEGVRDLVVSLAYPSLPVEQPRKGYTFDEVDAGGTRRLAAAGRRVGIEKVVYISGAGADHDAGQHWFRAKAAAEDAVRGSGMSWTILRPTWVFGPSDVALNRFLGFARMLPFVPMTNLGRQLLAPIFVRDVAAITADSLEDAVAAERLFEIGGPETLTMRQILHRALDVVGMRRPLLPGPAPLIKVAAWPMRFLPNPPLSPDAVDFINQPATVDIGPLMDAMPRRLTTLDEGLARYAVRDRSIVSISNGP